MLDHEIDIQCNFSHNSPQKAKQNGLKDKARAFEKSSQKS